MVCSPARESRHTGRRQPVGPWSLHVIKSLAVMAAGIQGLFQALDVAFSKDPKKLSLPSQGSSYHFRTQARCKAK